MSDSGRVLNRHALEINHLQLVRVVVGDEERLAVGRLAELAREDARRDAAFDGRLPLADARGVNHRQSLSRRLVAREAVRVGHDDLPSVVNDRDADGRVADGHSADARVLRVRLYLGGVEREQRVAVARRDVDALAVRRDRQTHGAATGGHVRHSRVRRVGLGLRNVNDDDRALRVARLRGRGVLAFGLALDGPAETFGRDLARRVEPTTVGRERQRDGRESYGNLADDGGLFETFGARTLQVDDGDGLDVLVAHEEKLVVGGCVDVDAAREIRVLDVAENRIAAPLGHLPRVHEDNVVAVGDYEQLAVVRDGHARRLGLYGEDLLQSNLPAPAAEHGDAVRRLRVRACERDEEPAAVGRRDRAERMTGELDVRDRRAHRRVALRLAPLRGRA